MNRYSLIDRLAFSVSAEVANEQRNRLNCVIADGYTVVDGSYRTDNDLTYLHHYVDISNDTEAALFKLKYL